MTIADDPASWPYTYSCVNPDCAWQGDPKAADQLFDPPPTCGGCGHLTELVE